MFFFLIIGRNIIKNKVKFAMVLLQETNKTMKDNNKSSVFLLLSQMGTAHVHSFPGPGPSSIWRRRDKSRGSFSGYPATKVQKQPNSPIPGLKLATNVNKSRPMPAYVPGVTPPPRFRFSFFTQLKNALSDVS